jgi:phosphatidylglycerol---prolipoprotein diacylglyceryl transferase
MPYPSRVYPVLFHIGALVIPAYGAAAAIGVLLALALAQRTARIAGVVPSQAWNLCVIALFAALIGSRLLLIVTNWSDLAQHPSWILGLGMVHHPLVGAAGALSAAAAGSAFALRQRMPLWNTADALAGPLAVGLTFEQLGALLAGSGYGTPSDARWAVTCNSLLAARWSGTPLGVPLHPVQAYAALSFLAIAIFLLLWLPFRRQAGDVAGLFLMMTGFSIFITELWRDTGGRGSFFGGALDGPQIAAIAMVIGGGAVLRERKALHAAEQAIDRNDAERTNHEDSHA